jgi:hypothetical protein
MLNYFTKYSAVNLFFKGPLVIGQNHIVLLRCEQIYIIVALNNANCYSHHWKPKACTMESSHTLVQFFHQARHCTRRRDLASHQDGVFFYHTNCRLQSRFHIIQCNYLLISEKADMG